MQGPQYITVATSFERIEPTTTAKIVDDLAKQEPIYLTTLDLFFRREKLEYPGKLRGKLVFPYRVRNILRHRICALLPLLALISPCTLVDCIQSHVVISRWRSCSPLIVVRPSSVGLARSGRYISRHPRPAAGPVGTFGGRPITRTIDL